MQVQIEYLAGPACGKTEPAVLTADGRPVPFRAVAIPARYRSALDDSPTVQEEVHRYVRQGDEPTDGRWKYTWSGLLH